MPTSAYLTHEIDHGPAGPKVGALFDLDGTLIAGFSVLALLRDRLFDGALTAQDVADSALSALAFQRGRMGFSGLLSALARTVRGGSEAEFEQVCERLFAENLSGLVYPEARAMVRAHRLRGHTLAIVSAATRYQVGPVARDLGIENVLCSGLEVADGHFTGRVQQPTVWGGGKRDAALAFAAQNGLDLGDSYFYTDGAEDLPLLEAIGRPRPTNPEPYLARVARGRGWPVRYFTSRPAAGWRDGLRTLGTIACAPGPALLSAAAPLLGRAGEALPRLGAWLWGRLGSAAAGIRLRVEGGEHLSHPQPAVYVFNHQSAIDALLLCRLMRGRFAWLVAGNPGGSPAFRRLAAPVETIQVEAGAAPTALAPALARLRAGVSLVAAHAGGAPRPRFGGVDPTALEVAAAARVPVIPIAIQNAQAALPTNSLIIREATIDVAVLTPIATAHWRAGEPARHAEALAELFHEVLGA
jgi:putative phosphoserine phosphatase/1-acylglycerol-3-phosphate O-acyltransferase